MIPLDNLHYDYREIDGYNKPFNFVLSARELGKTSMFWLKKVYFQWLKDKRPIAYLVRKNVTISEALIRSIQETILNKFTDDKVSLEFSKGSFKDGIVDVYIKKELFFRIYSLNIDLQRLKLATLPRIKAVFMDEYIIDTRTNEKYLSSEYFKIKELYSTLRREAEGVLKVYVVGNPYSLYNPLFNAWQIDTAKLYNEYTKTGNAFYVGDEYVIHWKALSNELREKLLELNPLYKFDEDYLNYALKGQVLNDKNIKIGNLPPNFYIKFLIKVESKFIAIYRNKLYNINDDKYYCEFIDEPSKYRQIYCLDLYELIEKAVVMSYEDKMRFQDFKDAIRRRQVLFKDIACYYLIEEVYKQL